MITRSSQMIAILQQRLRAELQWPRMHSTREDSSFQKE